MPNFFSLSRSKQLNQQARDVEGRDKEWIDSLHSEFKKSLKQTNFWRVCIYFISAVPRVVQSHHVHLKPGLLIIKAVITPV